MKYTLTPEEASAELRRRGYEKVNGEWRPRNTLTRKEARAELKRRGKKGKEALYEVDHPILSKMEKPFKPHGAAYNALGSFHNSIANMLNLAPEALNKVVSVFGGPDNFFKELENYQVDPGYASTLGDVAAYMIPATGVEKGLVGVGRGLSKVSPELLEAVLKKMPANLRSKFAQTLMKQTIANAAASAAVTPEGKRGTAALVGGTAGAVLPFAGRSLQAFRSVGMPEAAERYIKKFGQEPPFNVDEDVQRNLINDLANNYVEARNKSAPLYQSVFNAENLKPMNESSLKNYTNALENMEAKERGKLLSPRMLAKGPITAEEEGAEAAATKDISPEYVHFYQSRLGRQLARMARRGDYEGYEQMMDAKNALQKDLSSHLDKHGQLENYQQAKEQFLSDTAPYLQKIRNEKNSPVREIYNALDKNYDNGLVSFDESMPLKEGERYDTYIKNLIEKPGDTDLPRIHRLTNYLNGDRDKAIDYTKHFLFNKSYNANTGEINPRQFMNIYDKLSKTQKHALFSHEQQQSVDALRKSLENKEPKDRGKVSQSIKGLGNILGAVGAGTFYHSPEAAAAGFVAGPAIRGAMKQATHAFLPTSKADLESYLLNESRRGVPYEKLYRGFPAAIVSNYPGTNKQNGR